MKIERKNDRKKVFAKDVDYGTVVLINDRCYIHISNELFEEPVLLPFVNLESGDIEFFLPMEKALKVNAKLVID